MGALAVPGLAVNIGGYIGFNAAWINVVGNADRRATPDEIARMRALIANGLEPGRVGRVGGSRLQAGVLRATPRK